MLVANHETGSTQVAEFLWIIIAQFVPEHQGELPDLEQLLNADLATWAEQLDTEYTTLQQLDAAVRRALDEALEQDGLDVLFALSDCVQQQMTDIEIELKQGPEWLPYGDDDE